MLIFNLVKTQIESIHHVWRGVEIISKENEAQQVRGVTFRRKYCGKTEDPLHNIEGEKKYPCHPGKPSPLSILGSAAFGEEGV